MAKQPAGKQPSSAIPRRTGMTGSGRSRAGDPIAPARGHRYRPGTKALREIRRYQKSTDLLIAKAPFARVVSLPFIFLLFRSLLKMEGESGGVESDHENKNVVSLRKIIRARNFCPSVSITLTHQQPSLCCHFLFVTMVYLQVREVSEEFVSSVAGPGQVGLRWQSEALMAIQEAAEAFLVHLFEDA